MSTTFWLGVAASVVAALLVLALSFIVVRLRSSAARGRESLTYHWRLTRRLLDAGVTNFLPHRADFPRYLEHPTLKQFILSAQHEYMYVGLWLAYGVEVAGVEDAIRQLTSSNRRVELVFLAEDLEPVVVERLAVFLALSPDTLRERISAAWRELRAIREALPPHQRSYLSLSAHRELLTSSAQIIDYGQPNARILLDLKLFGQGREQSFAFMLSPTGQATLYSRVADAFLAIRSRATFVV